MKTFWMSFCDSDLPVGEQFLGVTIVDAHSAEDAIVKSHCINTNPGGQIQIQDITQFRGDINPDYKNRLLTREECECDAYLLKNKARH
jgi:hypothetical protein